MRAIVAAVAASAMLSGCWFVFIPSSAFGAGGSPQPATRAAADAPPDTRPISAAGRRALPTGDGDWCVDANTREGEAVSTTDGRNAKVRELLGSSTKCLDVRYSVKARLDI